MSLSLTRKSRAKIGDLILVTFVVVAGLAIFTNLSQTLMPYAAGLSILALGYSLYQRPFVAKNSIFRNSLGRPMKRNIAYLTYAIILLSVTFVLISMVVGTSTFNDFLEKMLSQYNIVFEVTPKL